MLRFPDGNSELQKSQNSLQNKFGNIVHGEGVNYTVIQATPKNSDISEFRSKIHTGSGIYTTYGILSGVLKSGGPDCHHDHKIRKYRTACATVYGGAEH